VFLWFAGLAFALVWAVFRDPAIDYRLVMVGALLPDVVDGPFGGARAMHSVTVSALLLGVVMVATRKRRALRRRLLALPIGTFMHLVLDGMWTRSHGFWWPFLGWNFTDRGLPSFQHPVLVLVAQEVAGAAALAWCWRRFGLGEADRRAAFIRTGRLARDVVG
jgi:membrane-bound metal-dependent hydrolase YbcI (DUF457 family)